MEPHPHALTRLQPAGMPRRAPPAGRSESRLAAAPGAPDSAPYALLDGARLPGLRGCLDAAGHAYWCLLCDDLGGPLRDASPYLVRLPDDRLLPSRGGVLVLAPPAASGAALREHLRGWLRAPGGHGRSRVFRFYDPIALAATLPLLADSARHAFLAPLGRVYAEDPDTGQLLEFSCDGPAAGRAIDAARPERCDIRRDAPD